MGGGEGCGGWVGGVGGSEIREVWILGRGATGMGWGRFRLFIYRVVGVEGMGICQALE